MSIKKPGRHGVLYFKPLLSNSYARLLSVKDDDEALISDQIEKTPASIETGTCANVS